MGKFLKFIGLTVLVLLIVSFVFNSYNSNPKVIISRVFKGGHANPGTFRYRIYVFGIFPVGEAVFYKAKIDKISGQDKYHLKAEAKSLDLISSLFKASAELNSYVDPVNYNPASFKQKVRILGSPNQDKEIVYDQKQGFMVLDGVKRQILPNTQDPLSLAFNLERMDFGKNKEIEMNINTNQKNYLFKGSVEEKQVISEKIKNKVYVAKVSIRRRDKNNPYHQSKVTIWFVKKEENIPILINVFASGFLINARLIEIK